MDKIIILGVDSSMSMDLLRSCLMSKTSERMIIVNIEKDVVRPPSLLECDLNIVQRIVEDEKFEPTICESKMSWREKQRADKIRFKKR